MKTFHESASDIAKLAVEEAKRFKGRETEFLCTVAGAIHAESKRSS
jgi:hypothetical protein